MAIRTKPLISAAALTSAAVVAASTATVASTASAPTPPALSAAQVQLTTFSDLLSITPEDWSNILFTGWGFAISPNQPVDLDWAAAFISPFTNCDFNCAVIGPSGVAYAALDALFNGNGAGIENVNGILQNPDLPYQPDPDKPNFNPYTTPPWSVSSINYFFEGGAGSGVQYLVTQPFGDPASPLYDPVIATLIGRAFLGVDNVSVTYIQALDLISKLAIDNVPFLGSYIYGGIQAYLGPNTSDEFFGDWGYFAGLSGLLRYAVDVVLSGGNPFPPYGPPTETAAAASVPASAAVAASEAVSLVESASSDEGATAPAEQAADSATVEAPADVVETEAAPTETAADIETDIAAVETAEVAPVAVDAEIASVGIDEVAPVEVAEVETAADVAPAGITPVEITPVEPPAEVEGVTAGVGVVDAAESAPSSAPAKRSPLRSARGAVERAAKSLSSAVGASKAEKAGSASKAEKAGAAASAPAAKGSDDSAE